MGTGFNMSYKRTRAALCARSERGRSLPEQAGSVTGRFSARVVKGGMVRGGDPGQSRLKWECDREKETEGLGTTE